MGVSILISVQTISFCIIACDIVSLLHYDEKHYFIYHISLHATIAAITINKLPRKDKTCPDTKSWVVQESSYIQTYKGGGELFPEAIKKRFFWIVQFHHFVVSLLDHTFCDRPAGR